MQTCPKAPALVAADVRKRNGRFGNPPRDLGGCDAAFSLIELMTAVAIMLLIIFGLYNMFSQTQKALRANLTQVDVLEAGRAASEMMGREVEQLAASDLGQTVNFYAGMTPAPPLKQMDVDQNSARMLRTNVLEEFFFLSRETNKWVGTGYRVIGANDGVGTLYRFSVWTNYHRLTLTNLMGRFMNAPLTNAAGQVSTNFHRVTEGVVHLRLTAYDPDGRQMGSLTTNMYPGYRVLRLSGSNQRYGLFSTATDVLDANVILKTQPEYQTQCLFLSNALPGYVELELGVLEPATWKQYQSLRDAPNLAVAFLKKQAAKVHLFRQRIPIRTALQ